MPTNRTKRSRKARPGRGAIPPEAVEAFRRGDTPDLLRALGLPDWHHSPLEVEEDPLIAPPVDYDHEAGRQEARRLRAQLESIS